MKPEMLLLLWAVMLTFVQMLIAAQGAYMQTGLVMLAGNREGFPALTGWAGRAQRAHRNMIENMVLFAALVFLVIAAGRSNPMTVLGAQLFFWGRLAYALIYLGGFPWVRTLAWFVSIIGLVLMALQLL
ncbi:MAG: MAPEG family protein [Betaproteobacteria bacterium]